MSLRTDSMNNISRSFQRTGNTQIKEKSLGGFSELFQLNRKNRVEESAKDYYVNQTKTQFTGTVNQRFQQLETLNAQTDWSSMTDVEKVKVFTDRYRAAFKEFDIVMSGLYLPYSSVHEAISDHHSNEFEKYLSPEGVAPLKASPGKYFSETYSETYKEAYYGRLTDEETRAAIMDKFKDSNSMESKYLMLDEIRRCGLQKKGEFEVSLSIELQIFSQVENANKWMLYGTNTSISQHPRFLDMFMSYAKGVGEGKNYMPSWTQIVGIAKSMLHPEQAPDPSVVEEIEKGMDQFLEEILG